VVFDEQLPTAQVRAVVRERDAERAGQVARAAAQFVVGNRPGRRFACADAAHPLDPLQRFERPDQHRSR
jgi:hypothetical protein